MTIDTFLRISDTQTLISVIGFLLSIYKFKTKEFYIKLLGLSLLLSVVGNMGSGVLHAVRINVNYSSSIYRILVFPVFCLIYYYSVGKQKAKIFIFLSVIFVLFGVIDLVFIQKSTINTYTLIMMSIIMIMLSLYYFYWLLRELPTAQLQRLPMFWVNSAFIIYFSGNLFLFLFTSYLVNVLNNNLLVYWTLHNVLGIIEALMIIVALWMDLRNIKSPS